MPIFSAPPLACRFAIALHRFLHRQGRVAGAQGVIFMRQRRAEQRHDAVAQNLIDGAFVAVHCIHHDMQDRIEILAHLFGIELFHHAGRTADVGEQYGHVFALPFDEASRRQNFFRQVLGNHGLACGRLSGSGRADAETLAALAAKFRARPVGLAAVRTAHIERRAALVAKARVVGIFGLAMRTLHRDRSSRHEDRRAFKKRMNGNQDIYRSASKSSNDTVSSR